MEWTYNESNHNLYEFCALDSINFKVGEKEVLKLLNALGCPDFKIKEIFSECLKDLERYNDMYTYEIIINLTRQIDDNAEDNPTEDRICKMEILKRMSEPIIKRLDLIPPRVKINVDKIYYINRKIKDIKRLKQVSFEIKDLRIKEKDFDYQIFITFILLRMSEIKYQNRFPLVNTLVVHSQSMDERCARNELLRK